MANLNKDSALSGINTLERLASDESFSFKNTEEVANVISGLYAIAKYKGKDFTKGSFAITPPELSLKLHDKMIEFYAERDYAKRDKKIPSFDQYLFSSKNNSLYSRYSSHYKKEKIDKQYGIDFSKNTLPAPFKHVLFGYIKGRENESNGRLFVKAETRGVGQFWDAIVHLANYFKSLFDKRDPSLTRNEKDVPEDVHLAFHEAISHMVENGVANDKLNKFHEKFTKAFDSEGKLVNKKDLPKYAINEMYSEITKCLDDQYKKSKGENLEPSWYDEAKVEVMQQSRADVEKIRAEEKNVQQGENIRREKGENVLQEGNIRQGENIQQKDDMQQGKNVQNEKNVQEEMKVKEINIQQEKRLEEKKSLILENIKNEVHSILFKNHSLDQKEVQFRHGNELIVDLKTDLKGMKEFIEKGMGNRSEERKSFVSKEMEKKKEGPRRRG